MKSNARYLIVNADDFGQSPGLNTGIVTAFEQGIVRSASLMVRWPAAEEAAAYARNHPALSVGLHIDLGEWVYRNEEWQVSYSVVDTQDADRVAAEIDRQLDQFRQLMGCEPTHLDSHQHVHRRGPVETLVRDRGQQLNVPVRHFCSEVNYCGAFYGQSSRGHPYPAGVEPEAIVQLLEKLPAGITEMACHPGVGSDIDSTYQAEREQEVRTLCDPRVRSAIQDAGIQLISFRECRELLVR